MLIGTELTNESDLNANRDAIQASLRSMFGGSTDGKFDLNNGSSEELANLLRGKVGIPTAEEELQKLVAGVRDMRIAKGGLIRSVDELSTVAGMTPTALGSVKEVATVGKFAILSTDVVGPKDWRGAEAEGGLRHIVFAGCDADLHRVPL